MEDSITYLDKKLLELESNKKLSLFKMVFFISLFWAFIFFLIGFWEVPFFQFIGIAYISFMLTMGYIHNEEV